MTLDLFLDALASGVCTVAEDDCGVSDLPEERQTVFEGGVGQFEEN